MEIIEYLIKNKIIFSVDWFNENGSFQITIGGDCWQEKFFINGNTVSKIIPKEEFLEAVKCAIKDEFAEPLSHYTGWPR